MPFSWVLALGRAQASLADRFRETGNFAWLIPWAITRKLFNTAAWVRYGNEWFKV